MIENKDIVGVLEIGEPINFRISKTPTMSLFSIIASYFLSTATKAVGRLLKNEKVKFEGNGIKLI